MIPNWCLYPTRFVYSLCKSANNNVLSSQIRVSHCPKRFSSNDHNENITSEDGKKDDKMKFLLAEMSILREEGRRAPNPDIIKKWQWEELLRLNTKSARINYYNFLFVAEKKIENDKIKKELRSQAYREFKERKTSELEQNPHLRYSVFSNTFLLRIYDRTMDSWRNNRLARAMQFGDKLIFDCSYDQHMSTWEGRATAKQLMISFSENRKHKDPFDLHFCNANFNGDTMKQLERYIPNMRDKAFPLNLHEGNYLNLFPKKQLVYLTPHCKNILTEYDPDSIYIIGAIVDKRGQEPLSLAKAKELGIKMAKLPLDRYLEWGAGSGKSLTLDQMTKILLDFKTSKSWNFALRHVPRRKIVTEEANESAGATKWTGNLNKFKRFRTESNKSDYNFNSELQLERKDQNTLSTADKFKRKIILDNNKFEQKSQSGGDEKLKKFNKNIRTDNDQLGNEFDVDNPKLAAEKLKKNIRTGESKSQTTCTVFPKDFRNK